MMPEKPQWVVEGWTKDYALEENVLKPLRSSRISRRGLLPYLDLEQRVDVTLLSAQDWESIQAAAAPIAVNNIRDYATHMDRLDHELLSALEGKKAAPPLAQHPEVRNALDKFAPQLIDTAAQSISDLSSIYPFGEPAKLLTMLPWQSSAEKVYRSLMQGMSREPSAGYVANFVLPLVAASPPPAHFAAVLLAQMQIALADEKTVSPDSLDLADLVIRAPNLQASLEAAKLLEAIVKTASPDSEQAAKRELEFAIDKAGYSSSVLHFATVYKHLFGEPEGALRDRLSGRVAEGFEKKPYKIDFASLAGIAALLAETDATATRQFSDYYGRLAAERKELLPSREFHIKMKMGRLEEIADSIAAIDIASPKGRSFLNDEVREAAIYALETRDRVAMQYFGKLAEAYEAHRKTKAGRVLGYDVREKLALNILEAKSRVLYNRVGAEEIISELNAALNALKTEDGSKGAVSLQASLYQPPAKGFVTAYIRGPVSPQDNEYFLSQIHTLRERSQGVFPIHDVVKHRIPFGRRGEVEMFGIVTTPGGIPYLLREGICAVGIPSQTWIPTDARLERADAKSRDPMYNTIIYSGTVDKNRRPRQLEQGQLAEIIKLAENPVLENR